MSISIYQPINTNDVKKIRVLVVRPNQEPRVIRTNGMTGIQKLVGGNAESAGLTIKYQTLFVNQNAHEPKHLDLSFNEYLSDFCVPYTMSIGVYGTGVFVGTTLSGHVKSLTDLQIALLKEGINFAHKQSFCYMSQQYAEANRGLMPSRQFFENFTREYESSEYSDSDDDSEDYDSYGR